MIVWAESNMDYNSIFTALFAAVVTISTGLFGYLRLRDEKKFTHMVEHLTFATDQLEDHKKKLLLLEKQHEECEEKNITMRIKLGILEGKINVVEKQQGEVK